MRFPRWSTIVCLVIALSWSVWLWVSSTFPILVSACHGFSPGDPYRFALSWSVGHPLSAGFLSALSFSLWPHNGIFGLPYACTYADYGHGYPAYWFSAIAQNAYPTYHVARSVFGFLFAFLLLRFFIRAWRWLWSPLPSRQAALPPTTQLSAKRCPSSTSQPRVPSDL